MSPQETLASASLTSSSNDDSIELGRRAAAALARLKQEFREGRGPRFLHMTHARDDLPTLEREAEALRARFRHLVVIGTGGSSLGAQAIAGALAPGRVSGGYGLSFLDNVDPEAVTRALDALDLDTTGFLAISKSGTTAETLALSFAVLDRLQKDRATDHVRFVVEPGDSPMRRLAARLGASVLDHDPNLGGRFSVLSLVGLLPALFLGLDARGLRAGAAEAMARTFDAGDVLPPPAEAAARLVALAGTHGIGTHVLMTYGDALEPFGLWWRQLVGESLGKDGKGITPVTARGTTDQHSQLQLYLAGPADKFF
ncbi:MAG: glucose-6-phosphate isomerase, partial [Alphaproteobacteria bacterium]|nr:glucose-6-phosphate isomerase [Alphaproteobacteria bacterium]